MIPPENRIPPRLGKDGRPFGTERLRLLTRMAEEKGSVLEWFDVDSKGEPVIRGSTVPSVPGVSSVPLVPSPHLVTETGKGLPKRSSVSLVLRPHLVEPPKHMRLRLVQSDLGSTEPERLLPPGPSRSIWDLLSWGDLLRLRGTGRGQCLLSSALSTHTHLGEFFHSRRQDAGKRKASTTEQKGV